MVDSTIVFAIGVGIATLYLILQNSGKRTSSLSTGTDIKKQSVVVRLEEGVPVRRSTPHKDQLQTHLRNEHVKTIRDIFIRGMMEYQNLECLGTRTFEAPAPGSASKTQTRGIYKFRTYKEIAKWVDNFASGLVEIGAKTGDRVGIYSKNREEWVVTEHACYRQNLIVVSLYDTLGEDSVEFITRHSESKIVVVSKENLAKLLPAADRLPSLQVIIQMEPRDESSPKSSERFKFFTFDEIVTMVSITTNKFITLILILSSLCASGSSKARS
jgi:long-chain acyl-CoA synthetase